MSVERSLEGGLPANQAAAAPGGRRASAPVCAMIFLLPMASKTPDPPDDDLVPVFGTWPRIYGAVIVSALLVMGLLFLFSGWPY